MRYTDFDRIIPGLYVGAFPAPGDILPRNFDTIVFCAKDFQPPKEEYPGIEIIRARMVDDELTAQQEVIARQAALAIAQRVRDGKQVLVTCAAGINRSAFIAAVTLVMLTGKPGWWALNLVRSLRKPPPGQVPVLSNRDFEAYLLSVQGVKVKSKTG